MKMKNILLALSLAFPLSSIAAVKADAYKFQCGKFNVITFTEQGVLTLNGSKMDDVEVGTVDKQGHRFFTTDFREYAAAGGTSTKYRLVVTEGADPVLVHAWVDADDNLKRDPVTEKCSGAQHIQAALPTVPSMGEVRASEG